jgi:hypothetical protein
MVRVHEVVSSSLVTSTKLKAFSIGRSLFSLLFAHFYINAPSKPSQEGSVSVVKNKGHKEKKERNEKQKHAAFIFRVIKVA